MLGGVGPWPSGEEPTHAGIRFVNFTLPGRPTLGPTAETARIAEDGGVSVFT
jgi:hypothetical protein